MSATTTGTTGTVSSSTSRRKYSVEEETGEILRKNNEEIVKYLNWLRKQRKDSEYLIERQIMEKAKIESEIEKLTFKLTLLCRSMNQRMIARSGYDKTIKEIEEQYAALVAASGALLDVLTKEARDLEEIMDKNVGTSRDPSVVDVQSLKSAEEESSIQYEDDVGDDDTDSKTGKRLSKTEDEFLKYVNDNDEDDDEDHPPTEQELALMLAAANSPPRPMSGPEAMYELDRKPYEMDEKPYELEPKPRVISQDSVIIPASTPLPVPVTSQNGRRVSPTQTLTQRKKGSHDASVSMFGEAYSRQHSSATPLVGEKGRHHRGAKRKEEQAKDTS